MSGLNDTAELAKSLTAVLALLAIVAGYVKWVRPRYRAAKGDAVAVRDSLLGRDAIVDSITGEERAPALPSIGKRVATLEEAVTLMVDQHLSIQDHEKRILALEQSRVEQVVNKMESTAAFHAMAAIAENTGSETSAEQPADLPLD